MRITALSEPLRLWFLLLPAPFSVGLIQSPKVVVARVTLPSSRCAASACFVVIAFEPEQLEQVGAVPAISVPLAR